MPLYYDCSKLLSYFSVIPDPRVSGMVTYPLDEIFLTTFCAVISGYEDWVDVELYGNEKLDFLRHFLPYDHGIPSHEVFSNVFGAIDVDIFNQCFTRWTYSLIEADLSIKPVDSEDRLPPIVALDGKTACGSQDRANGKEAIHIISAFAHQYGLVLGQRVVDDKSNEITAIPKLIESIVIEGCTVTIDAMGCQKNIAQSIGEKNADYVLCVKENQPSLHDTIARFFRHQQATGFKDFSYDSIEDIDKDHGRIEIRKAWVSSDIKWLEPANSWPYIQSVAMVQRKRIIKEKETEETCYYISSLPQNAHNILHATRAHWSIENNLHWVLDVEFGEDKARMRKENQAANANIIRKIALNLLKKNQTKASIKSKRKKAAVNNAFLMEVIRGKTIEINN